MNAVKIPDCGLVLGIDVGWAAEKKTTGACALIWTPTDVTISPLRLPTTEEGRREGIRRLAGDAEILALAVDGPIRGTLDEIAIYRDAELMLTRALADRIGKPGQSSSGNGKKLNAAANAIARLVLSTERLAPAEHKAKIHESAIVEAFPTTFLGVMLDMGCVPGHGARSDAYFRHLLGPNADSPPQLQTDRLLALLHRLLPNRRFASGHLGDVRDHEERAAVVCALTALCVVCRSYVAVGDQRNGYIVLPPLAKEGEPGLQPWAWEIICRNRPKGAAMPLIVEP